MLENKDGNIDSPCVNNFKFNKRTLADLCDLIQTDEKKDKDNMDDPGTSDCDAVTTEGAPQTGGNAYGSDDEANGILLEKIQGKILGVLKLDSNMA